MNGLEAFADAIQTYEGWKPGTRSYRNRNPGNLRGTQPMDDMGYNVYPDFIAGYSDLLVELRAKITGHNKRGILPTSTLVELMEVYAPRVDHNDPNSYARFVSDWLTKSLGKPIGLASRLSEIYTEPKTT